MRVPVITGLGEASGAADPNGSLETLVFAAASAALGQAGLSSGELDGVVLAASDQVDGRAITSMLTAGPAGAYLDEEINLASSPGHALVMGYLQIMSGTHRRLLVSSWGKASESAGSSTQAAERLSAEPFFDRDGGLTALAAAALQAQVHRSGAPDADRATARVASRNHGTDAGGAPRHSEDDVLASEVVAYPLRRLEIPVETDGAYSIVLEAGDRDARPAASLAGVGWCSEASRIPDRDLRSVPHLAKAAEDAFARAGLSAADIGAWELHDYTPDAELLAYEAVGLCEPGGAVRYALDGRSDGDLVNRGGGSAAGEAPFGGPLRKVINAARTLRDGDAHNAFAQTASGLAGQFQSAFVLRSEST